MLPGSLKRGLCKSCKENGLQCDKKKPRCSECVATNKPCGGYDMGHIFINVDSSEPPPTWNRGQSAQKHLLLDLASQPATSPPQTLDMLATYFPWTSQTSDTMPLGSVDASKAMLALADPAHIHRLVELFLDIYLRRYGPGKTPVDPLTAGNECGGWRLLLPSWLGQSVILDTAIGGMAASFIGSQTQDVSLSNQGGNMYLNALQMVQKALPELGASEKKHLLATTLVMSSTELFMSNGGGSSQLTHIEGATRMLHLSLDNMDLEELHVYILNQGMFEAISSRRSYPCSSPGFRHLARQIYSVPRTSRNDLFFQWCERILPLPNILSATDSLVSSTAPAPVSAVLAILNDLSTIEQILAPWYELLQSSIPSPWTSPAAQASADSVPFPLQFTSIEACTNYCLYWTSQLLILEARQMLHARLPRSDFPEHAALQPRISEYASLVCRSVQYCASNTSYAATENMFMPLHVVSSYYVRRGDHDRVNWCRGAFARMEQEHKIGFASRRLHLVGGGIVENTFDPDGVWDRV
ncbi:hypothetical protein P171DRAFT_438966 [Karstenula rhodostoma CBS 690.94]|uniref:Zn(2)-C6 fungal-type domain-containing protein n=1 Tax=Karstenula rhodostoma CBS 690.94 TaxID=1392251 RepID=A0A9P4PS29_9PLEO|nr:hypothetical protein P171DRAFT_438966 [Karstenula rhodostoma CBS 690.94]